jgi:hypothetical protein
LIEIADPDVLGSLPGNGNLASDARVFQHDPEWQPLGEGDRQQSAALRAIANCAAYLPGTEDDGCFATYAAPEISFLHGTNLQRGETRSMLRHAGADLQHG